MSQRLTYDQFLADLAKWAPTETEQIAYIHQALQYKSMLHIFGRMFFPHIIRGIEETPDAHHDLIDFLASPKTGAAIYPRGFAKSTWEKIDTIHDVVYKLEPVMVYVGDTLGDAQLHFEGIKSELEGNDWLRKVYGDLVPKPMPGVKWNNTHLETTTGINLIARGAGKGRGANIKNRRPTKIIIDDGETDEMVRSSTRREKYHHWVTHVVIPSLDKERGRLKMIGTVIHPACEVLKFFKARGGIFRRAIENGESIWPSYWPIKDLFLLRDGYTTPEGEKIEGIGTRAFSQEYLNQPINDDTVIFKQQWIDDNAYEPTQLPPLEQLDIVIAIDPNAGLSAAADSMGCVVMGKHRQSKVRYVLAALKRKCSIEKRLEFYREQYKEWKPRVMGIESVLNQTADYQLALATNEFNLIKLNPGGLSKIDRSYFVQPKVEQGIIKFNPSHGDLYDQIIAFPNAEHDDLVDAFLYANSLLDGNTVSLPQESSPMVTANLMKKKF